MHGSDLSESQAGEREHAVFRSAEKRLAGSGTFDCTAGSGCAESSGRDCELSFRGPFGTGSFTYALWSFIGAGRAWPWNLRLGGDGVGRTGAVYDAGHRARPAGRGSAPGLDAAADAALGPRRRAVRVQPGRGNERGAVWR